MPARFILHFTNALVIIIMRIKIITIIINDCWPASSAFQITMLIYEVTYST